MPFTQSPPPKKTQAKQKEGELTITPNILIPILVQAQRTTRMLHKQIQHPNPVFSNLRHLLQYQIRNQIRAPALRRERDRALMPGHGVCVFFAFSIAVSIGLGGARWLEY